jgi:assimilatory nitrate reductase catalytic subunit
MAEIASTCCYCGVGCGVLVDSDGAALRGVRGDPAHPANFGRLCTKGLSLKERSLASRALYPELQGSRTSWDEALDFVARRLASTIERHGPDSVGFYVSGQLLTEEYYVFNKLAKGLIGTNNVDTNSRLCMSSAVAGYKQTLGADAPPACYEDIEAADCVFIAGSNTAWAHPVLFRRLEEAKGNKTIIVVDPRRTDTARAATLHLAIAPGTDVALFNGMLHVIVWEGWADEGYIRRHTEGFDAVRNAVREFTPKATASACGIPEIDVIEAARLFARCSATLSLYCQGLNQSSSGTAKNAALINLHLATGQIGKPGAGPFSLTGQPNAMGGREVGGMANLLPGHREVSSPAHRNETARLWGVPRVPEVPGKTAVEMFEAARAGEIRILWIACTNPAQSLPNQKLVREAVERAELVIVQDAFRHTETAAYADVFLPAASWGEKDGTMTNSERRIARVRAVLPPPGEARPDWEIVVDLAARLTGGRRLFPYKKPEDIFDEHRETTRGRDLDITGISYALLDERGPQQWPFPEGAASGKKRLYEDGVFPTQSGRARFVPTPYCPVAEDADARYPLRLTTGRLRDQWHGMSRTGALASLFAHEPEPRLYLHPEDLVRRRLKDSELVKVASRRGELHIHVAADPDLRRGVAFLPMHWGARFLGGAGRLGINELTLPALDPSSRQPELKHCAIRVERAELPWRLVAFGPASFEALTPFMDAAPFAARTLIGRERVGVRLQLAFQEAPAKELIDAIDRAFGLDEGGAIRYEDPKRAIGRRIALADGAIRAVRLSGDTRSERWLKDYWERAAAVEDLRRYLLLPVESPPGAPPPRGRTVCSCFDVAEREIGAFSDLATLQEKLKCGTNCGSCLPELRRLVAA